MQNHVEALTLSDFRSFSQIKASISDLKAVLAEFQESLIETIRSTIRISPWARMTSAKS